MSMTCATFAYPRLDTEARGSMAARLADRDVPDAFALSTCLRIEVAVPGDRRRLDQALTALFGDAPLPEPEITMGGHAALHLFRVAAGLESPIVGEPEILTQVRQAVAAMKEAGSTDGLFLKLLETGVAIGRRARDTMALSAHDSMASVAAQLAGFTDHVAVLGSGTMAAAVVKSLHALPVPPRITLLARSPETVRIEDVTVLPFDRLPDLLRKVSAVVSATSASTRLLSDEDLEAILAARSSQITLVDMAMPPDFRPPDDDRVVHYDIDDLARMADRHYQPEDAEALVAAAANSSYRRYVAHHDVGPLIGDLMRSADDIVSQAVDRFSGRLSTADDAAVLRQTAHTVARSLLAAPVAYLNETEEQDAAVAMLERAFNFGRG
jgi:glutamyl-tRNA reductase